MVRRILKKHGYLPDLQDEATKLVLEQAEVLRADLAQSLKTICEGGTGNNSVPIRLIEGLENRFALRFQKENDHVCIAIGESGFRFDVCHTDFGSPWMQRAGAGRSNN